MKGLCKTECGCEVEYVPHEFSDGFVYYLPRNTNNFCIDHNYPYELIYHSIGMKQTVSNLMGGDLIAKNHLCVKCKTHLDVNSKMLGPILCKQCKGDLK
jgi:hypothetical protein